MNAVEQENLEGIEAEVKNVTEILERASTIYGELPEGFASEKLALVVHDLANSVKNLAECVAFLARNQ